MKWLSTAHLALLAATGLIPLPFPSAQAATPAFTLNPAFCTPICGASKLADTSWIKSRWVLLEEQTVEVDISAADLLQAGQEGIFISTMSGDQAFAPSGQFTTNASGGGIGIVLGSAQPPYHSACVGANADNRQFGIFGFTWADPWGASAGMVACKNIAKGLLASGTLRITATTVCGAGLKPLCSVTASLKHLPTGTVLATADADAVRLENPTSARKIWYGVSNYYAASPNYPVGFVPRRENYRVELDDRCDPICP